MNCTPLCINQDEKFIQVKLTPLRSIFKYGYIVNLIFLYKQVGDLLSIHSHWGRFGIYNYRFDIYNMPFSFSPPPYPTSPQPSKLHFLFLLASSLTNDSGWYRNQIFIRDSWLKTNKRVGSNQIFGVRYTVYAKY